MKAHGLFSAVVPVVVSLVLAAGVAAGDPMVLRYAGQLPTTHHITKGDYLFAKLVEEKTAGKVKIEVYPAGQLYKDVGIIKAVTSGAIDMGITFNGAWTGSVPLMDVFDLNFLFKDYAQIEKAWQGKIGDKLREEMEKHQVKALGFGAYGDSFCVANRSRTLLKLQDFSGLKIRGNNAMAADTIKALGGTPAMMASSEVYMALQRGTIDGAASGPTSIVQRKWFEVANYVTVASSSYSVWPIMINLNVWKKLPRDVQDALQQAAAEVTQYTIDVANSEDEKAVKFLSEKGKVTVLSDADRDAWKKAMEPVRQDFLKRTGKDGETLMKWIDDL